MAKELSIKKICIVTPCYNEAEALPHLLKSLTEVRKGLKDYQMDVLLVNDGSSDNTEAQIEALSKDDPHIYYISFAHNAGHQSALRAGINATVGYDAAIMLDADLQHPPELIPKMLEAWQNGAQIVQMLRQDNVSETGFLKTLTSKSYYKFINWISDLKLNSGESDFRLIDHSVIGTVSSSNEQDLFLRGYFSWLKVRKTYIEYHPAQRVAGVSKYNYKKMLNLAYKGVLQFSEKPLQVSVTMGIGVAFLSFLYGLFLIIRYLAGGYTVSGWTSLMVVMLFCVGVNFILLGFIGTYLAHSIRTQKQRPEFVIAKQKLPKF